MAVSFFKYENQAKHQGYKYIIGVDEAGRGPLAGPVVAAAVCLRRFSFENKICDSKRLSSQQRERAMLEIHRKAYVGVGIINESVIDTVNILQATYLAMTNAVLHLTDCMQKELKTFQRYQKKIYVLVDGNRLIWDLPFRYKTVVGGDTLSFSISCASIVAKVTRDRILNVYNRIYPQYGFHSHKGYPTRAHRAAIQKHGPSGIQRKTFRWDTGDLLSHAETRDCRGAHCG